MEAPQEIYPQDIISFDFGGYMCGAYPSYLCAWKVNVSDRIRQQYPDIKMFYCIIKNEADYENELYKVRRALDQQILKLRLSHVFAGLAFYNWETTKPLQLAPPVLFSEDILGNSKPPGALYWSGPSPTLITFAVGKKDFGCYYQVGVSSEIRSLYPGDYYILTPCDDFRDYSEKLDSIWRRNELWLRYKFTWIDNHYYSWIPVIIKSCSVDKTTISYGEEITVTVTLKNTDPDNARSVTVGLYKSDGNQWTYPQRVAIGRNSEETVTFKFKVFDIDQITKGIYVRVGDVEMVCGSPISVTRREPKFASVVTSEQTSANLGETISARAQIKALEYQPLTLYRVRFRVYWRNTETNQVVKEEYKEVDIDTGLTTTSDLVRFSFTPTEPGAYAPCVDDNSYTVTYEGPSQVAYY